MKRVAAKYLYPLTAAEPIRNGFVEYDDDGTILQTGVCADPAEEEVFLDGAVIGEGSVVAAGAEEVGILVNLEGLLMISHVVGIVFIEVALDFDSFAIKAASPMYTRTFLEVFGTEPQDCAAVIRDVKALQEQALACGLDAAPTPHACYTMSPELLTAASAEGLRSGYLSYHSEETPEEDEMIRSGSGPMWENRKRAGMSTPPVTGTSSLQYFLERLQQVHAAPFDEHILLVHEVCMDQEGIDAVKAVLNHPFIALCPLSNLFIHNALPPVELLRSNEMKLTIGTDSLSSNDDLDPVAELFCLQENFPQVPLGEMLGWACRNGAEFLGKEAVFGTLEPGKRPGLVLIDHLSPEGRLTTASASYRIV